MTEHVHFTVYKVATGEIKAVGYGPSETAQNLKGAGDEVVTGAYSPNEFYLPGGVPTRLPPRPDSQYVVFDYAQGQWVDPRTPQQVIEDAWRPVRRHRDNLLSACDWAVLPDVPMAVERRQQWESYRQALRDITDQTDPAAIVWPAAPT